MTEDIEDGNGLQCEQRKNVVICIRKWQMKKFCCGNVPPFGWTHYWFPTSCMLYAGANNGNVSTNNFCLYFRKSISLCTFSNLAWVPLKFCRNRGSSCNANKTLLFFVFSYFSFNLNANFCLQQESKKSGWIPGFLKKKTRDRSSTAPAADAESTSTAWYTNNGKKNNNF